jgi:hypothetical protein
MEMIGREVLPKLSVAYLEPALLLEGAVTDLLSPGCAALGCLLSPFGLRLVGMVPQYFGLRPPKKKLPLLVEGSSKALRLCRPPSISMEPPADALWEAALKASLKLSDGSGFQSTATALIQP